MEGNNLGLCSTCKARVPSEFFDRDGAKWIRKHRHDPGHGIRLQPALGLLRETLRRPGEDGPAGGRRAEPHMFDGSYVVTLESAKAWRKQLNLLAAYLYFYNPLRLLVALIRPKSRLYLTDSGMQVFGMWGLAQTVRRTIGWAWRLWRGPIARRTSAPASRIPMRGVDGQAASHDLPRTTTL
jgi:hypothetical protein